MGKKNPKVLYNPPISHPQTLIKPLKLSTENSQHTNTTNKQSATMQFSTSTTLATLVLSAGQAFAAQCKSGLFAVSGEWATYPCKPAGRNRWSCIDDGTLVFQTGSVFTLRTGREDGLININCSGGLASRIQCPAGIWGRTSVSCPGEISIVYFAPFDRQCATCAVGA